MLIFIFDIFWRCAQCARIQVVIGASATMRSQAIIANRWEAYSKYVMPVVGVRERLSSLTKYR